MALEHHKFTQEFPEMLDSIHELDIHDSEFSSMMKEYDETDDEIYRIEQDIETPPDIYTEALKMKRVELKDRLYERLRRHMQHKKQYAR